MSDNQQWQAPGASQPPPPSGQPAVYGAPQYAAAPPGWTPPPKPGLVPLRPMTLGTILAASFQVMRRNPRTTLVPALVLALLLAIASSLGIWAYMGALSRVFSAGSSQDAAALAAGGVLLAGLALLAAAVLATVATALLQAITVLEVARGTVGERLTLGQLWAAGRGRFGAVIGYTALLILAATVAIGVVFGLIVLVGIGTAGASGSQSTAAGAVFAVLGFFVIAGLGGFALWAWLSTRLAFVPAAIVLERLPIRVAIRRSWGLTRGFFWRTFGIQLLVAVMISIAGQIVSTPVSLIFSLGGALIDPTAATSTDPTAMLNQMTTMMIAVYALTSIVSAIGLVVQSATSSLLYLDLRMRKEGLDLELARFVEARQTGAQVPDPYLPRPAVAHSAPTAP